MLVVATPSGTNGHQVLERVLAGDEAVRVLSHDPSRLDPSVRERVEVVKGSLDDPIAVNKAFSGADSAFVVVPPDDDAHDVEQHYLRFAQSAAGAAKDQGVKRLVWASTLGRDQAKALGHYAGALAADEPLETASDDFRIFRPAVYMDNLLWQIKAIQGKGVFALPNTADQPHLTVATRDIAATAAALLLDHGWSGRESVPLIGDALTPNQMASVMSDVLQTPIRYQQLTSDEYKASMTSTGASDAWAQGIADMVNAENAGFYDSEPDTSITMPTDFRTWCEAVLKPCDREDLGARIGTRRGWALAKAR
jgi:uncharacterized protein YbjT (DUF2867 family)